MNQFPSFQTIIRHNIHVTSAIYHIDVEMDSISQFCMYLSLLKFGIVKEVLLRSKELIITLSVNNEIPHKRGQAIFEESKVFWIITENEINLWLAFYLQQYWYGWEELDHLDVELESMNPEIFQRVYIVLATKR